MMPSFGAATIALAVSLFTGVPSQNSTFPTAPTVFDQPQTVEQYIRESFSDEPIMAEIASCESHFRQFVRVKDENGLYHIVVLKNAGSTAVGVFQIMSSIHADFAMDKLAKTDINTLQGNAAYARYLYEREGTRPWDASKACWSRSQAYKDMQSDSDKVAFAIK